MEMTAILFFSYIVESIIIWQYSSELFEPKRIRKIRLLALCGIYLILFCASLVKSTWLNISLYLIANFIFLYTQYHLKWYSALFHTTIITAIMGTSELIVYAVLKSFTPDFWNNSQNHSSKWLFLIFNKLAFFMIINILTHLLKKQRKNTDQTDKSVFLLLFIPISSIFVVMIFATIGETLTLPPSIDLAVSMGCALLLVANLLVFGINQYNQKQSQEFTEMQLHLQKEADSAEYHKMLLSQNENQRILIHDIKNHLQSIEMLNDEGEPEKVHGYIEHLLQSSDLKETSRLCDHELLNSILCRYNRQCNEEHIDFHTDIHKGTVDFLAENDLTSLFCNLLDNAVEAACNIPDSFIELTANKKERTPFMVITVTNSCRINPFSGQDDTLISRKPDKYKHGLGIKSIRKIVSKYDGDSQMYYQEETHTFHTIIALKFHSVSMS